jgi:uncharacterized protein
MLWSVKGMRGWRILGFVGKREIEVLDSIDAHIDLTIKSVEALRPLIAAAIRGDWLSADEEVRNISRLESEAADLRRRITLDLCAGAFFAGLRESFINLAEIEDKVADASKDASRIITQDKLKPEVLKILYEDQKDDLNAYLENIRKTVETLKTTVNSLRSDKEQVLKNANEVERWEKAADETKLQLIKRINSSKDKLGVLTFLQLRDFVLALDNIADAAEDASDIAIVIVAKIGA